MIGDRLSSGTISGEILVNGQLREEKTFRAISSYVSQEDKKELSPAIKAVLKKYKMKGSIAVRHHSTLVVNVRSGVIDFSDALETRGNICVNQYWIDENYTGAARDFLNELLAAMEGPKF